VVSSSETYGSGLGINESNPLFRQSQSFASMSQYAAPSPEAHMVDPASMSQLALPTMRGMSSGRDLRDPSPGSSTESGPASRLERGLSDDPSSFSHSSAGYSPYQGYPNESYPDEAEQPILPPHFPHNGSSGSSPEPSYSGQGYATRAEPQPAQRQRQTSQHGRGVSLVDAGPVPVGGQVAPHDPVRRVSRHQRRSSSRNHLVSPVSSNSHASQLPPGAVSVEYFSWRKAY
jgi:chitin synthase